jgi:hypothetical protein
VKRAHSAEAYQSKAHGAEVLLDADASLSATLFRTVAARPVLLIVVIMVS